MPIDRKPWRRTFEKGTPPYLPCPYCNNGKLKLCESSLSLGQTAGSLSEQDEDGWDPELTNGKSSCVFKCNNPGCRGAVACCAHYGVERQQTGEDEFDLIEVHSPRYFDPPLPVFRIPRDCPEMVRKDVEGAFALHWADPMSAANRIRSALERLMDHARIPRRKRDGKGSSYRLQLHNRIQEYGKKAKDKRLVSIMTAMKWIGNEGSHGGKLSRDDVFDAFDLLEHTLKQIFDDSTTSLVALSQKINRKKGPLSRQRQVKAKAKVQKAAERQA